jgi:hypothetical protein
MRAHMGVCRLWGRLWQHRALCVSPWVILLVTLLVYSGNVHKEYRCAMSV